LIRDLEAYRAFARLTPEQRGLLEKSADARALVFWAVWLLTLP
jgi:hypothetical protein